jgi:hypothetical protein
MDLIQRWIAGPLGGVIMGVIALLFLLLSWLLVADRFVIWAQRQSIENLAKALANCQQDKARATVARDGLRRVTVEQNAAVQAIATDCRSAAADAAARGVAAYTAARARSQNLNVGVGYQEMNRWASDLP